MSDAVFDCTQIITIEMDNDMKEIISTINRFEEIGINVLVNEEIDEKMKRKDGRYKGVRKYFENYLFKDTVILDEDEFLGYYNEWEEREYPPFEVKKFVEILLDIIKKESIKKVNLIIVSTASEEREDSYLVKYIDKDEVKEKNLLDWLFNLSFSFLDEPWFWCFDIIIFKFE
ncbi:hypothetical protein CLPU_9c00780 [Gottschalkia purinilytica]|uniref:Uncharacterized protein n=1 Tax=Gottschalkia purinilytica TaxID=1503 RepID=A0A0L0W9Q7_GOTPU|nr:hypothetical protein [Gottschalkia purinilytica]KNF08182.1 hypothetical protein CLPU_9c00780 [Gottschalkia purinilytica]